MARKLHNFLFFYARINPSLKLILVWFSGLLVGVLSTVAAGDSFISLMRPASFQRVSIVGLVASALVPFLLCAYSVYIHKPKVLYIICFLKALLFAQCGFALAMSFGSADWLVRILYQFTDLVTVPFLCWFSLRHISDSSGAFLRRDILVCMGGWTIAASIDYCVVSPFLVILIDI